MHSLAHLFCRLLLHVLALTLSSSFCLAAENDDARRKEIRRPPQTGAVNAGPGRHLPPPASQDGGTRSSPSGSRPRTDSREPKAISQPATQLTRTHRLLLAALRVWELKNGYRP